MPLARHFLEEARPDSPVPGFDDLAADYLVRREYPGNVRELKQLVGRVAARHVGSGAVTLGEVAAGEQDLQSLRASWRDGLLAQAVERAIVEGVDLDEIGRAAKEAAIRIAVQREDGNLHRAAQRLGVTDRALQIHRARWANAG
jgi:DNA-binding NtrC family response regulator